MTLREKRGKPARGRAGGKLSDLYGVMFKNYRILPSEIAKQDPKLLFCMLDDLGEDEEYGGDDPYLKMFYGL